MSDPWDDPEVRSWAERVERELVPMIEDSAATISLVPSGEADIKFAVELGLSIMLGKPIILVVKQGVQAPDKLVKIADAILEDPNDPGFNARLQSVLEKLLPEAS